MPYAYSGLILLALATTTAFAQGGKSSSMFGGVLPMMLVMFAIIYFLMIRPEQKKLKQRQQMMNQLKKGDKILTVGGIYGTVTNAKGDVISVKIADNTVVDVTKSAVTSVITKENEDKEKGSK